MPGNLRQRLAIRRLEIVAQSAELRRQLSGDAAAIHRRIDIVTRLLTLFPVARLLIAKFWRGRR
jgi:hypothetical protein